MPGALRITSLGEVDGVLFPGFDVADEVFVHGERAVVGGVCFARSQGPLLIECAGSEGLAGEGDEADAGRG